MRKSIYLCICIIGYFLYGLAISLYTGRIGNVIFVWNVVLAFMPYLFVQLLHLYRQKSNTNKGVVVLLAFLWLIFFPNAPYMVTDLMYIAGAAGVDGIDIYSLLFWIKLLYLAIGAMFAALMGLSSLHDMHQLVLKWKGRVFGSVFLAVVCLLSGLAIYVGRVLRFNSWDVLRPVTLLKSIAEQMDMFTVLFSLLFAGCVFGTYIIYNLIAGSGEKRQ